MSLYRGSRYQFDTIKAEEVHPNDLFKFPEPKPERVIWASDSQLKAEAFAVFAQRMRFRIGYSYQIDGNPPDGQRADGTVEWVVETQRELTEEELDEPAYIYEIPEGEFTQVGQTDEFYSLEESVSPSKTEETTVGALLAKWRHEGNIEIRWGDWRKKEIPKLKG